eukprot:COSAG04_NODE_1002_length_8834_cov_10.753520_2_plen_126_part_00
MTARARVRHPLMAECASCAGFNSVLIPPIRAIAIAGLGWGHFCKNARDECLAMPGGSRVVPMQSALAHGPLNAHIRCYLHGAFATGANLIEPQLGSVDGVTEAVTERAFEIRADFAKVCVSFSQP